MSRKAASAARFVRDSCPHPGRAAHGCEAGVSSIRAYAIGQEDRHGGSGSSGGARLSGGIVRAAAVPQHRRPIFDPCQPGWLWRGRPPWPWQWGSPSMPPAGAFPWIGRPAGRGCLPSTPRGRLRRGGQRSSVMGWPQIRPGTAQVRGEPLPDRPTGETLRGQRLGRQAQERRDEANRRLAEVKQE